MGLIASRPIGLIAVGQRFRATEKNTLGSSILVVPGTPAPERLLREWAEVAAAPFAWAEVEVAVQAVHFLFITQTSAAKHVQSGK
jgi:hypothetical protein